RRDDARDLAAAEFHKARLEGGARLRRGRDRDAARSNRERTGGTIRRLSVTAPPQLRDQLLGADRVSDYDRSRCAEDIDRPRERAVGKGVIHYAAQLDMHNRSEEDTAGLTSLA